MNPLGVEPVVITGRILTREAQAWLDHSNKYTQSHLPTFFSQWEELDHFHTFLSSSSF